jgi:hypothetical protein
MAASPTKSASPIPKEIKASSDAAPIILTASPHPLINNTNDQKTVHDANFLLQQVRTKESNTTDDKTQHDKSNILDPDDAIQQVNLERISNESLRKESAGNFDITYITDIPPGLLPITIRKGTKKDISRIVDILTSAFWDEDAVGIYLHPKKTRFPSHVKKFWRRKLRMDWVTHTIMVAVIDNEKETEHGKVVGLASWYMNGGSKLGTCKYISAKSSHTQLKPTGRSQSYCLDILASFHFGTTRSFVYVAFDMEAQLLVLYLNVLTMKQCKAFPSSSPKHITPSLPSFHPIAHNQGHICPISTPHSPKVNITGPALEVSAII